MLSAVSALGAQNIGAGKQERAIASLRYAVLITVGFGVLVSILIQFTAGPIVSLFTEGADVIRLGSQYLRGYMIVFLQAFILVSAVISVPVESPCCHFCTISCQFHWFVSPEFI